MASLTAEESSGASCLLVGRVVVNVFVCLFTVALGSLGLFGLREDLRAVQHRRPGQSDRHRAEPGQRRGAEGCCQELSGERRH